MTTFALGRSLHPLWVVWAIAAPALVLTACRSAVPDETDYPPPIATRVPVRKPPRDAGATPERMSVDAGRVEQPEAAETCETDPLMTGCSEACGPARENPYGYPITPRIGEREVDGSCAVCEAAPKKLPKCVNSAAPALSEFLLRKGTEQRIRARASLTFVNTMCTMMAGPCACNNRCNSRLALLPPRTTPKVGLPHAWLDDGPLATETDSEEFKREVEGRVAPVVCHGDDASTCCPFELEHGTQALEVVVQGKLRRALVVWDDAESYVVSDYELCRVGP